jgi:hypothetical protein
MDPNLNEKEQARKLILSDKEESEESIKNTFLFSKEEPVKEVERRISLFGEEITKKKKNKKPQRPMKGVKKRRSIFDAKV